MAKFEHGNMWSCFNTVDHFVVTTNSYVRLDGALVMGRGIAKQVRDRFPGVDKAAGQRVNLACGHLGFYGLLGDPAKRLMLFQVKRNFKADAELSLIEQSTQMLAERARNEPHKTFALNFPGIGNGRLKRQDVMTIIETLPDNVTIWSF